jgi:exosome complex component RRP42
MTDYIKTLIEKDSRIDGRKLNEYRKPVKIEYGVSSKAEGSAKAIIGDTEVIAGVKFKVGAPYADNPNEGTLITTVELLPLSSPDYLPGPPKEGAIELARIIDRGVRESKMIDMKKLCIKKGELVWTIFLDIYSINDDGNLIDAAALAALAALKSAVLPKLKDDEVVYGELTKTKLPLDTLPITSTIVKIGDKLMVDPCLEEEEAISARLSIAVSEKGNIHAMQLGEFGGLSPEECDEAISMAKKTTEVLRKVLK